MPPKLIQMCKYIKIPKSNNMQKISNHYSKNIQKIKINITSSIKNSQKWECLIAKILGCIQHEVKT